MPRQLELGAEAAAAAAGVGKLTGSFAHSCFCTFTTSHFSTFACLFHRQTSDSLTGGELGLVSALRLGHQW